MMISLQLNNLILRPNLKTKTTNNSQNQSYPSSPYGLSLPLSIEEQCRNHQMTETPKSSQGPLDRNRIAV